jgi:transcriptional regulator with XRE-family HTH domain
MATITPTIRLRRLGMALRDHREAAGLTLDEAARLLMRSPSSLSRIEKGLHHVPVRDLEYILGKYGVTDPAVRDRLFDWCRNGRKKGWWQRYATDLSPEMMDFIGLEADAMSIELFELILVPGLRQSEAYVRIATVDSLTAMSYREEEADVRAFSATFDRLRSEAFSEQESQRLISRLLSEL